MAWRTQIVDNLEVLIRQHWSVGINEVYADGYLLSKGHPNDVDGYFVRRESLKAWLNGLVPLFETKV